MQREGGASSRYPKHSIDIRRSRGEANMTIDIYGHVSALESAGDQVLVRIQVESSRMRGAQIGTAPFIEIIASRAEVDSYCPGMAIHIQVRPGAAHAAKGEQT
jgi:hypothetical protein